MRLTKALVKGLARKHEETMNYQERYYAMCEMHHDAAEENKALRELCGKLEAEKAHLQKDVGALEEYQTELLHRLKGLECRQETCDRNRQFIDDATNFLGPMAKRLKYKIDVLANELDVLEQMSDAYHSVGVKWPWQE